MAAYNEEIWIERAVRSILNQTLSELELIVINDGSTDNTLAILYGVSDSRLRILDQVNRGIARSVNWGLSAAKGTYIARMDADDWSRPDRLALQIGFLESHPQYGMIGSWCKIKWEDTDKVATFTPPVTDTDIRRAIIWENPFVHSSVIIRKAVLDVVGMYDPNYLWEDYELWWRVVTNCKVANFPEELVVRTVRQTSFGQVPKSRNYWEKLRIQAKGTRYPGVVAAIYASLAKTAGAFLFYRLFELIPSRRPNG
jgi:glycosyltransferase involved in cell wall biosynthesis